MTITQQPKASFTIDLTKGAQSSLAAHQLLSLVDEECCFHTDRALRPPLGIYNISISRVCEKLAAFCSRLEQYIVASQNIEQQSDDNLQRELVDYIELAIYAAAEHIDDLKAIAAGFFKDDRALGKDASARRLLTDIKNFKEFISATANAIKHQQARIRLYSLEFRHSETRSILHGYFIEGVEKGIVGPSIVFHQTQNVFSITTLAWEILLLLLRCSNSLKEFLLSSAKFIQGPANQTSDMVSGAVIAAARLPLFTFDEEHSFTKATFVLTSDGSLDNELDSKIYGSFLRRWSLSNEHSFGGFSAGFVGDGVTRSFTFPSASRVGLQHWQQKV
jgi:hypothetical protein